MFVLTERDMQQLISSQKQKLDEMLKSGIPIVYGDDSMFSWNTQTALLRI